MKRPQRHRGFTLIELMIVIAIIAILASIAIPSYQEFAVRAKISEGVIEVASAKVAVADGYTSDGTSGLSMSATTFNATPVNSKYVQSVIVSPANGVIYVTFVATAGNGIPAIIGGKTLTFTPSIAGAALPANPAGAVDWACASASHDRAVSRGLPFTAATLPPQYSPSECR